MNIKYVLSFDLLPEFYLCIKCVQWWQGCESKNLAKKHQRINFYLFFIWKFLFTLIDKWTHDLGLQVGLNLSLTIFDLSNKPISKYCR
jgi:hypothetical protein